MRDVRILLLLALAACEAPESLGQASGAACNDALTYADDIAPIMQRYCTDCHAASVPLERRQGAPGDHDFDSELGILAQAAHVERAAAAGPLAQNRAMPPASYPRQPSDRERELLGEWLACQAEHDATQHDEPGHAH